MPTWSIQLPSSAQYENISDSVDWVLRDHMCKFCTCGGWWLSTIRHNSL